MISPGELTALVIAVTGLIAALAGLYGQMRSLSRRVDGRLSELLELTRRSSKAEGVLEATPSASVELTRGLDP